MVILLELEGIGASTIRIFELEKLGNTYQTTWLKREWEKNHICKYRLIGYTSCVNFCWWRRKVQEKIVSFYHQRQSKLESRENVYLFIY